MKEASGVMWGSGSFVSFPQRKLSTARSVSQQSYLSYEYSIIQLRIKTS